MSEPYFPASEFLNDLIGDKVPLPGGQLAETDLLRLIALTRDVEVSNRDWATLLLAQQDLDTPEVRAALLHSASDENEFVAAEAILGLAQRDRELALPLVQQALGGSGASVPIFEAAELLADSSLIEDLRDFTEPSDNPSADRAARDALKACEAKRKGSHR